MTVTLSRSCVPQLCLRATCDSLPIYQFDVSRTEGARTSGDSDSSSSSEYVITQADGFLAKYSYLEAVGEDGSADTNSSGTLILATKAKPSTLTIPGADRHWLNGFMGGHIQFEPERKPENTDVGGSLFYYKKSSTFEASEVAYTIPYADSSYASGVVAYDTVQQGSYSVKEQPFGAMTVTSKDMFEGSASGILGLSFEDDKSDANGIHPFWQKAKIDRFSISILIGIPAPLVHAIYKQVPDAIAGKGSYKENFKAQKVQGDDSRCYGSLFSTSSVDAAVGKATWIVGASFLRNVYAVFRASSSPAIGFAMPVKNYPRSSRLSNFNLKLPLLSRKPEMERMLLQPKGPPFESSQLDKQSQIRESFFRTYRMYAKPSWNRADATPLSLLSTNPHNGDGATIVESLAALHIMDLREEFEIALNQLSTWISKYLTSNHKTHRRPKQSSDTKLLNKAKELGDQLQTHWSFNQSAVPYPWLHFGPNQNNTKKTITIAQAGALTLQFNRLSHWTGNKLIALVPTRPVDISRTNPRHSGPIFANINSLEWAASQRDRKLG
ncbi:hypothetical protein KEM48_002139 [Puccinia striiformis f. sp. tritici PST-130]|nr:hypothetical protein KEM48_002139 [Puccinia striiformis f. sp. tritici PST-130]